MSSGQNEGGMTTFIYPDNLKAKARLWLWELRDVGIIGAALLLAVFLLAQSGSAVFLVCAAVYAFLTIRLEDSSILDFLYRAALFLFLRQQYFEWEEPHE